MSFCGLSHFEVLSFWPLWGCKEEVMSKTGWKLLLWPQSCLNNDWSLFMRAFQKKSKKLFKAKKNMTIFWHNMHTGCCNPYMQNSHNQSVSSQHLVAVYYCFPCTTRDGKYASSNKNLLKIHSLAPLLEPLPICPVVKYRTFNHDMTAPKMAQFPFSSICPWLTGPTLTGLPLPLLQIRGQLFSSSIGKFLSKKLGMGTNFANIKIFWVI